ncbi:putative disease resistance RPP13-like protein 1 [Triticum aestivum]|uniref:AAA+ ATPase domain-containing protein n=1 Tax=Triticum aestivum TaxID=4565 RepID=A0A3B5Y1J1_WHEAT|nr:putative disease resistance RPP13-like protein 1 [Triticum aestivum]XP_044333872.1 putative disease resistance RPP13-like protein 1 [Triticum aestivum]
MAVVLDAFVPYVKKMITSMAEEEVRMLLGVSGEIKRLEANLVYLQGYLADAERRHITDKSVKVWVGRLKDAMYEATDILELCQLEAMERPKESGRNASSSTRFRSLVGQLKKKLQGFLDPLLFCLQNPAFTHEIGGRIKRLNGKLDSVRKDALVFNFHANFGSYEERRQPSDPASHSRINRTTPGFDESSIVGDKVEMDTEELVHKLTSHGHDMASARVKVVSIVGPGGMGKSTLAKKVFAQEAIKVEFKTRIWLGITRRFDKAELLRAAITHAGGKHGGERDESMLETALTDALLANRFLLVLDDVWSDRAWKEVLQVPVVNAGRRHPGSRVLVTTRNEDVAFRMGASGSDQIHVSKLDEDDAWSLLKKQLPQLQDDESHFDQLKDVGMKIIEKCDGLPLAIKVMGGLLSTRHPSEREWEIVLNKNLEWEEHGSQEELNYSVHLSYDDLSPELKQCFLYYSLFPKGSEFLEDIAISMWVSEGFVQADERSESDQLDLEEIGAEYHRELVARNLLETNESAESGWAYIMHDVVRSFARFVAREEALVVLKEQTDIRSLLSHNQRIRRLSMKLTNSVLEWDILEKLESLRTLVIACNFKPGSGSGPSLASSFASLRALDISFADCDWLVDHLSQLRHLRYLSFTQTDVSRLPHDIHKMKFLEHIALFNCRKLDKLPDGIVKLGRLRYLSIDGSSVDVVPKGFGALTNLRSVYGFPAKMVGDWCTLEELEHLFHLRTLRIHGLENVPGGSVAARAMIGSKKHLSFLDLICHKNEEEDGVGGEQIPEKDQERIEAVFDELCPPPYLEDLFMAGYFGRRLPYWMRAPTAMAFKSLTGITLTRLRCCTQLPDGLCGMVSLEGLAVNWAPAIKLVGPDFQALPSGNGGAGDLFVTRPFPKLKNLKLHNMTGWEEWDWAEEEQGGAISMPALEYLSIIHCMLSRLPPGLASSNRYNLRTLDLSKLSALASLENFPSVMELDVLYCPKLKKISGFAMLRRMAITDCPELETLEGVPVLKSLLLNDEPWEIVGTSAYQAGQPRQLPQNLTITR